MDGASVLATGGEDASVRLWDPVTGTQRGPTLTGHTESVRWGAWGTVDGTPILATRGEDRSLRLWDLARERPVVRHRRYSSDTARGLDQLARQAEAGALADLITARSAAAPLAGGVFGPWGEGKSQFLTMIQAEVEHRSPQKPAADDPITFSYIRQVRFNAWHYAETDLWAGLVAELFNQLSTDTDPTTGQRQQSRLAADMLGARRIRERLVAAQQRLRTLQQNSSRPSLPRRSDDLWARVAAVAGDGPAETVDEASVTFLNLRRAGRTAAAVLSSTSRWVVVTAAVLVVLTVLALITAPTWLPTLGAWTRTVLALPAVLFLIAAANAIKRGWAASATARADVQTWWQKVRDLAERQEERRQNAEAVAAAEVAALTAELQNVTAAGQLAGLVQDRAAAGDYRSRLGLMTQIRRDFETMTKLLMNAATGPNDPDVADDKLPAIDRIVLYIDDLDRCPPNKVVDMLEAVHLLLAVELFVVVIAVDPRWLLTSLATHYQQMFPAEQHQPFGGDEDIWAATPAQYLEKIFQVVFTLQPMDTAGYQRMMNTLIGTVEAQDAKEPAPLPRFVRSADAPPAGSVPRTTTEKQFPPPVPAWKFADLLIVDRIDPFTVTPDEQRLLKLLGPPLITGPRSVKRLANSYGLLAAIEHTTTPAGQIRRSLQPDADDPDAYPYRAAAVLLAAVIGYPMLGPGWFPDLYQTAHAKPDTEWTTYLHNLRSDIKNIEATPAAGRTQLWNRMLDNLENLTALADDDGLPLPKTLRIWCRWVIPVGRLSFPTGSAVIRLRNDG